MNKTLLLFVWAAIYTGCAPDQSSNLSSTTPLCQIPASQNEKITESRSQNIFLKSEDISHYAGYKNFIVKFKENFTQGLKPTGNTITEYKVKGLMMKTLSKNSFTFALSSSINEKINVIQQLAQDNDVEYIEPDYEIQTITDSNVENFQATSEIDQQGTMDQWSLTKVQAPNAWNVTSGNKDIVVAVLDSGIDYTHNDLKNNIWTNTQEVPGNGIDDDKDGYIDDVYGWNFADNNSNPISKSTSNHGTHVAGIIGGTGIGISGVAQNVKMMALKFIGEGGSGFTSAAIQGIDYAIKKKVFAINNSWGSSGNSKALEDAIGRAEKAGILFVVAAGNGSKGIGYNIDQTPWYPTSYENENILTVAATGTNDSMAAFSNFGKKMVDVAAPGLSILSTLSNQSYGRLSGTSMAAPVVTGLAVLVKAANPSLTAKQVIAVIRNSVDRVVAMTNIIGSGGRVNAFTAVRQAVHMNPTSDKLQGGCL